MEFFANILRWLRGRVKPHGDSTPYSEAENPETWELFSEESSSEVMLAAYYDKHLFERARTQWQFGDWESLARIERESLYHHPQRASLALFAAAGHQQRGDMEATREFTRLAKEWGASKKMISQVLIAGVYNTLGKASALCGLQQRAIGHFEESVRTAGDGEDVRLLTQARSRRELDGMDLSLTAVDGSVNQFFGKLSVHQGWVTATQAPPTLGQLYSLHKGKVSDKWSSYLIEYERIFSEYRNRPVRLLEVGVQNGGSLEIWAQYFAHAQKIIGCDINPKCGELQYDDPRISVVVGGVNSDDTENEIFKQMATIDIIIDDGSHRSSDIVKTFLRYFEYLTDGGVYIAEDLHCSYWQKFEGGLFAPHSSMAFFKRLADIVNYEHWGVDISREEVIRSFLNDYDCNFSEDVLQGIYSIKFCNSLCIIRKEKPSLNLLMERFVAGKKAEFDGVLLKLHGTIGHKSNESDNPWSMPEGKVREDFVRSI
jgi:hypothetical protein